MGEYVDLGTYEGLSGFQGAVGKMVRARHQLRALEERFQAFAESRPYRLSEKFELRPGEEVGDYSFVVESVSIPKRKWGVLIGELVHNLRSGLDHAVYAAAKVPSGATQFPIFTTRPAWDTKNAQAMVATVPDEVAALIEQAQPYHASEGQDPRKHFLAILNRLSNYDKHRILHTTVMTLDGAAPGVKLIQDVGFMREIAVGFGPLEPGHTLVKVTLDGFGPEPKLELYGEFAFGIAFTDPEGHDLAIEGAPVFDTLLGIYRLVEDLVIRMEFICKP